MAFLYFDETIQDSGAFIVGALVISASDLSPIIKKQWGDMGLNPAVDEYKSSTPKLNNPQSQLQREFLSYLVQRERLALVVLPNGDRGNLGEYCTKLLLQLKEGGFIPDESSELFLDDNIRLSNTNRSLLGAEGIESYSKCCSIEHAGIQAADHAAHALGSMLMEEMGLITKRVRVGENSGCHPDELIELGFELWASIRYALIGKNEYIEGLSPHPEDPANPYFRVDGAGLYIAPTCNKELEIQARKRFGINYLGCIH